MFEIVNDHTFEISIDDGKVIVYTSVPNVSCSNSEPGRKLKQLFDIMSRAELFRIMNKRTYMGVHVLFPNTVLVSIQWGAGNYGDNHDVWATAAASGEERLSQFSNTAEVAVWINGNAPGPHRWITTEYRKNSGDDVLGYQTSKQVLHLLQWAERFDVSTIKPKELPEHASSDSSHI